MRHSSLKDQYHEASIRHFALLLQSGLIYLRKRGTAVRSILKCRLNYLIFQRNVDHWCLVVLKENVFANLGVLLVRE